MAKREFLQLAHTYVARKHGVAGWFMSEKLDGMRVLSDGGMTRGMPASDIPWANVEKDGRLLRPQISTGLWSRYGKIIHAPAWWLDMLPKIPMDGELYMGRGMFQHLVSAVKSHVGDFRWKNVRYKAFDTPPVETVFGDGEINNTNFKKRFNGAVLWWRARKLVEFAPANYGFTARLKLLKAAVNGGNEVVSVHEQEQLAFSTTVAEQRLAEFTEQVCSQGGEGVMLKNPSQLWLPERTYAILKHKPWHDNEGTVVGYKWGRETDKESKLLGLMGALILEIKKDNGSKGTFKLSGFTDEERELTWIDTGESAYRYGTEHPGEDVPDDIQNAKFPRGAIVTYKYRELTDDDLPKEARFLRQFEEV